MNYWEVTKRPLTVPQHNQFVEIQRYGVVKLVKNEDASSNDWVVFHCLNEDDCIMTRIAIRRTWIEERSLKKIGDKGWKRSRLIAFLLPCF
jgi:hypothetical protein